MLASKNSQSTPDAGGKSADLYPKKVSEGPAMDYMDSNLAFPKSGKKKKKGKK